MAIALSAEQASFVDAALDGRNVFVDACWGARKGERRPKGYRRAKRKLEAATRHVENQRHDALTKVVDAFCRAY